MRTDLREARRAKGITQGDLAEAIGRNQADVSKIEAGKASISIDLAPKIAERLGLSILDVLYGVKSKQARVA